MIKILIGLGFVLFDFNISLNSSVIGIFPDLIGYVLIFWAAMQFSEKIERFSTLKIWSFISALFSAAVYVLNIIGPPLRRTISFSLEIIGILLELIVIKTIINCISDIEKYFDCKLGSLALSRCYTLVIVSDILVMSSRYIEYISLICLILHLIVSLVFLILFNRSRIRTESAFSSLRE